MIVYAIAIAKMAWGVFFKCSTAAGYASSCHQRTASMQKKIMGVVSTWALWRFDVRDSIWCRLAKVQLRSRETKRVGLCLFQQELVWQPSTSAWEEYAGHVEPIFKMQLKPRDTIMYKLGRNTIEVISLKFILCGCCLREGNMTQREHKRKQNSGFTGVCKGARTGPALSFRYASLSLNQNDESLCNILGHETW